ncbi:hypothetical protein GCM10020254_83880 [Streptomyces goshikiensis]
MPYIGHRGQPCDDRPVGSADIPPVDQRSQLAHRGGRPLIRDISTFRGIAARYEKTVTSYEAAVTLASLLLWARSV